MTRLSESPLGIISRDSIVHVMKKGCDHKIRNEGPVLGYNSSKAGHARARKMPTFAKKDKIYSKIHILKNCRR